jgi:hypothetical protein
MRISVSDLDSYLYWKSSEDMPLEDLLKRLRREQEPTHQMLAGRAFHKALENATTGLMDIAVEDGFTFRFDLDENLYLPEIRELKGEVTIPTNFGPATLVGVVDGLYATTINDYKLTERFDAERYADSYQWRSYLMMFNGNKFRYDAFIYRVDPKTGEYIIYDYSQMSFYRYDGMEKDVQREVNGLAEIIHKYLNKEAA